MIWLSNLWNEFKNAKTMDKISWIVEISIPIYYIILWIIGKMTSDTSFLFTTIILFILLLVINITNVQLRRERDAARKETKTEQTKSDQNLKSVYEQKKQEVLEMTNEINRLRISIRKLENDLTAWKDKSAKWEDIAVTRLSELHQWQNNCQFLVKVREELKKERDDFKMELDRIYESEPSLNPVHSASYLNDVILVPETPDGARFMDIVRKLNHIKK